MIKKFNKRSAGIALSQILILLIGIVAFSYTIGIGFVSADVGAPPTPAPSDEGIYQSVTQYGTYQVVTKAAASAVASPTSTAATAGVATSNPIIQTGLSSTVGNDLMYNYVTPQTAAGSYLTPAASVSKNGIEAGFAVPGQETFAQASAAKSAEESAAIAASNSVVSNPITTAFDGQSFWQVIGTSGKILFLSALAAGAVAAAMGLVRLLVGAKPGSTLDSILTGSQISLTAGTFAGTLVAQIFPAGIGSFSPLALGFMGGGGVLLLTAFIYVFTQKDTKQDTVAVQCSVWEPPYGGADCNKCGQNGLPCTAYQCASLGTGCALLNEGIYGQPMCIYNNTEQTQPVITFLGSALSSGYSYTPLTSSSYPGNSGDSGKLITPEVEPYTTLSLGITTDQPAKCLIGPIRWANYSNMTGTSWLIGTDGGINGDEGLWGVRNPDQTYNHTFTIPIFENQTGTLGIQKSGQVDYFIRCNGVNNHPDVAAYVIQFNVDQTPDVTPPEIVSTTPLSGVPVSFGVYSTNVSVYTNKPVNGCRWSHTDQNYANMINNMSCISSTPNSLGLFTCIANLTGILGGKTNNFYFRCNDTSGNVNQQSYPFSLSGSNSQLSIISASPNQTTISGSTTSVDVTLNVQTAGGYNSGNAACYYSATGSESDYLQFSNTNSAQSSQDLWLQPGPYLYYLKCVDIAGDADYSYISFNVRTATTPPNVVRAYHDSGTNTLDIQTDENATCVYDIVDCTYPFSQGTKMTTFDNITHYTNWVPGNTYYIKCEDQFGNQPQPSNVCSIILSPSSI